MSLFVLFCNLFICKRYRSILTLDGSKVRRVYDVARERYIGMKHRYSHFTYQLPFDGTHTRYLCWK